MNTRIFTNEHPNTLFDKFRRILKANTTIHEFDILVGYFRASGYFKVRPFLENIPQIRILVGINVDEPTQRYKAKGQQFLGFADDVRQKVLEDWKQDIQGSSYQKEVEEGIIQFMEDMMSGKVQIKASKDKTLHSKVYIFRPQGFDADSLGGVMITGSSNLTEQGLGTHHDSNYEFNVELRDYIDVKFATDEFEKLWATAVEVLPADIKNLKKQTFLHDELSPFELYLKFLIEYFGKSVEVDEEVFEVLPRSYTRLQYQADAISEGIKKLEQHNGFILADVVGLGKTIVACAILKKHLIKNAFQSRILVVHPPAVRNAWRKTIRDFKIEPYIELVTNGSLHKIIDNQQTDYSSAEKFDVVVVDESHKFRADNSQMYSYLQLICKTPYQSYSQYTPKKVMLLSATPLNNKPEDIANQIYLFQDARLSTLEGVPNLQTFFAPKFKAYQSVKKEMKDFIVENPTEVTQHFHKYQGKSVATFGHQAHTQRH
jgi:SNF2 family DNA or RNA helicase